MLWCVSINGRPQPIDKTPGPSGNIYLDESTEPPVARVLPKDVLEAWKKAAEEKKTPLRLYTSHHGTCPRAADFRKKSAGSATGAGVFGDIPKGGAPDEVK
jgi:hypothetical protein